MDDLLDTAPCGFFTLTDDGIVQQINQTLRNLLGHPPGVLAGQQVARLLSPGSAFFFQTYFLPRLMLEGAVEEVYLQIQRADGAPIPVLANARRRHRGGAYLSSCVVVPVRQRSQYEHELLEARKVAEAAGQAEARARLEAERANEAKSSFLAMMSHELRTPLNAIIGLSEALGDQIYGPLNPRQEKAITTIGHSGLHLLALINDVLDMAKVGAGKLELHCERLRVEEVCQASLSLVREAAATKQMALSLSLDPRAAWITADARRLTQILVNLLSNAVKFTPPGGDISLTVSLDTTARLIRFTVADTGIGIAPEHLKQLFQPFTQIDSRLTREYQGTGLGLALVKELTALHGGAIAVDSQVGVGSTFTVSLPCEEL